MATPPVIEPSGLPPVVPPSGKFIAQLFIIPMVIVGGIVTIMLGFTWLVGGPKTIDGFMDGLRSQNPEVRWRTASDLAQIIQRDEVLASTPEFGLRLTMRLQETLAEVKKVPPKPADVPEDQRRAAAQAWHTFQVQRSEVQYLTACVGGLSLPVGAKLLNEMATSPMASDPKNAAFLQRQAVWALATLGNNRARYEKLTPERKAEILGELDAITSQTGERATWAKAAADGLRDGGSMGVILTLAKCASADDPFVRKQAALALSFWKGLPDENRLADETLMTLTRDDGHGATMRITEDD